MIDSVRCLTLLLVYCAYAANLLAAGLDNSNRTVYESDGGYVESPPRSAQARYAAMGIGARVPTEHFRFPHDTRDETGSIYGVDVSHHNGNLPWNEFPKNNVAFVVAKATEGQTFKDSKFMKNWLELKHLKEKSMIDGRPRFYRGAYHFFTPSDPEKQARAFLKVIGTLEPGDLPPTLDLEWTSFKKDRWKNFTGEEIARRALIWLKLVEQETGRVPMIYTNAYWWNERKIQHQKLKKYPLWVANYSKKAADALKPSPLPISMPTWRIWQFTDKGYINNVISKGFDVNMFHGDLLELEKLVGLKIEQPNKIPKLTYEQ